MRCIGAALGLLLGVLGPAGARADVPRACIHPHYEPLECMRETRRVQLELLPLARLRELARQQPRLAHVVALEDAERNRLIETILEQLLQHQP
jgi:hypothetical protein